MPRAVRVTTVVVWLLAFVGIPVRAAEPIVLVINVINYAGAASGALTKAQHHVARVYGVAGVKIVWREGVPSSSTANAGGLSVVILSDSMAAHKAATEKLAPEVLGTAAPAPTRRAWIFLRRIEEVAARRELSTGQVLGHVIAHEVAHTVANVEHSGAGLMAPRLRLTSDNLQGFTKTEGEQLRAALLRTSGSATLEARDRSRPFRLTDRSTP